MTQIKTLVDEYGIINTAIKVLPDNLKINFLEALAELEDNQCHQKRSFPKTRLHVVKGIKGKKFSIYRQILIKYQAGDFTFNIYMGKFT